MVCFSQYASFFGLIISDATRFSGVSESHQCFIYVKHFTVTSWQLFAPNFTRSASIRCEALISFADMISNTQKWDKSIGPFYLLYKKHSNKSQYKTSNKIIMECPDLIETIIEKLLDSFDDIHYLFLIACVSKTHLNVTRVFKSRYTDRLNTAIMGIQTRNKNLCINPDCGIYKTTRVHRHNEVRNYPFCATCTLRFCTNRCERDFKWGIQWDRLAPMSLHTINFIYLVYDFWLGLYPGRGIVFTSMRPICPYRTNRMGLPIPSEWTYVLRSAHRYAISKTKGITQLPN